MINKEKPLSSEHNIKSQFLFCLILAILSYTDIKAQSNSSSFYDVSNIENFKKALKKWTIYGSFPNRLADPNEFKQFRDDISKKTQYNIKTLELIDETVDIIDIHKLIESNSSVAYAECNIFSNHEQDMVLHVAVNGVMRAWVNEEIKFWDVEYNYGGPYIKKIHIKKGNNIILLEIDNNKYRTTSWWFHVALSNYSETINSYTNSLAAMPKADHYLSCRSPLVRQGEDLQLGIADPDFIFIDKQSKVEIFDANQNLVSTQHIDLKNQEKVKLTSLPNGTYRYKLYTDRDTFSDYFIYGAIHDIYNKEHIAEKYKDNHNVYNTLVPYIYRLDRLLSEYKEWDGLWCRKVAFCLYKVQEIEIANQKNSNSYLTSEGMSLRKFQSKIDNGDEYYLLYVPENLKQSNKPIPLSVIVPYVTNNHPFYTGGVIANTDRLTYITRFAEKFGIAVLWPSARVYKYYNQTPIITQSIIETIEDVKKYYTIDNQNIFLYGDCSGGLFAYQAMVRRPDLFRGIAVEGPELTSVNWFDPSSPDYMTNNLYLLSTNFHNKPVQVLHSDRDYISALAPSIQLMEKIKENGAKLTYNNLNNEFKSSGSKVISEPQSMHDAFRFFSKNISSTPSKANKFATYALYNDTIYGFYINEKIKSGLATLTYEVNDNRLNIKTTNIKSVHINTKALGIKQPDKLQIYANGKESNKGSDYKIKKDGVELILDKSISTKSRELEGPINKVFLKSFAVVKPKNADAKSLAIINSLDSLWLDEYRNHIPVIDENKVDSAKIKGVNLIYIVNEINSIPKSVLAKTELKLANDKLTYKNQLFDTQGISFAFYHNDTVEAIYLGTVALEISKDMLKFIFIKEGWYDYELWNIDKEILIQEQYIN